MRTCTPQSSFTVPTSTRTRISINESTALRKTTPGSLLPTVAMRTTKVKNLKRRWMISTRGPPRSSRLPNLVSLRDGPAIFISALSSILAIFRDIRSSFVARDSSTRRLVTQALEARTRTLSKLVLRTDGFTIVLQTIVVFSNFLNLLNVPVAICAISRRVISIDHALLTGAY